MNRVQFEEKVRAFESLAERHPVAYRLGAVLFAVGGYAVIFALLAMVVGLMGMVAAVLLLTVTTVDLVIYVVLVFVTIAILRALWVRVPEPEGDSLRAVEAPELFREVEEIRRTGKGPRIHEVLLTRNYNASVVQHPRFGLLGWHRNYLMLGAPLMMGLDAAQFRAVLAHEIGHLSAAHSKLAAWVYRLRVTWNQMLGVFQGGRIGGRISGLFQWYLERFNAYTFVLSRLQEVEADRFAARVAGSRALADALVAITVHSRFLDTLYWTGIENGIRAEPVPAAAPFSSMEESLKGAMLEAGKHRWLDRALLRKTNFCDTHPALRDRVAFLNELARLPEAPLPSAADCYLGSTLNARLSFWDRQWTRHVSLAWAEKHKELRKNASRLEQLQERAALDADEQWEIASLTEALEGGDAAIPLIRVMIERNPAHVTALFNLGRLLVQRDDEEGIAYLEEAMKRDRKAILPACDWIARFWEDRGQPEKARAYWTQLEARGELMEKNAEERRRLSAKDTFLPHELSPAELEPILQRITGDSDIEAAYLVRKALKARMEDPLPLVLALLPRHAWYALDAHQTNHELQTRMAAKAPLPSAGIVVVLSSAQSALLRKIRKAPGAEIYRRGK